MLYFCSTAIPPIPNPLSASSALTLYGHLFPGDLKEPGVRIGTIFVSQVGQERLEEAALLWTPTPLFGSSAGGSNHYLLKA